jgi:hypothetical protein
MEWIEIIAVEYSSEESSSSSTELTTRRIGEGEGEDLKWLRRRRREEEEEAGPLGLVARASKKAELALVAVWLAGCN